MSPANLVREEAKDKAAHGEAEHETGRGQTDPDLSYEGLNCGSSRCILRLYICTTFLEASQTMSNSVRRVDSIAMGL